MSKALRVPVLLLAVLTVLLTACGSEEEAAPPPPPEVPIPAPVFPAGSSLATIQQEGRIQVGVRYDQPPFGLRNAATGQLEGFDVEMAKLMAHGIFGGTKAEAANRVDFVETVSRNRESFLQENKVDIVIAAYPISEQRRQFVDFAGPYFEAHGEVLVRNDATNIRAITDLNGKNVCVVRNSTYGRNISQLAPQATQVPLDNLTECANALRDRRVDAVVNDNVLLALIASTSNGAFRSLNASFTNEPYGIGVKKDDGVMRAFLNDRLAQVEADGQWQQAFQRTLGVYGIPVPPPPAIDRSQQTAAAPPTTAPGTPPTTVAPGATTTAPGAPATTAPATTAPPSPPVTPAI